MLACVQHCFLDMFSSCENSPVFVGFKGTRFRLNLRVEIKYIQMYQHFADKLLFSVITLGKNLTKKQVIYPNSSYMHCKTFQVQMKFRKFMKVHVLPYKVKELNSKSYVIQVNYSRQWIASCLIFENLST